MSSYCDDKSGEKYIPISFIIIEYLKIEVRCQLIFTCINLFEKYKLVLFIVFFIVGLFV